jgi:hypothetical protein
VAGPREAQRVRHTESVASGALALLLSAPPGFHEGINRPADLSDVAMEGERGADTEALHNGKADRVGQREVLVVVLGEGRLGTGLIPLAYPDHHLTGPQLAQGLPGDPTAKPVEEQAVQLEEDDVGPPSTSRAS